MGEPGLDQQRQQTTSRSRPGSVILFGAVATASGATVVVAALITYAMLSAPGPASEPAEIAGFRTPQGQLSLWVKLVMSSFLTLSGIGIIRTREWARTMFLALAVVRAGVVVATVLSGGEAVEAPAAFAMALAPDVVLFGIGAWFLTRGRVSRFFASEADGQDSA